MNRQGTWFKGTSVYGTDYVGFNITAEEYEALQGTQYTYYKMLIFFIHFLSTVALQ